MNLERVLQLVNDLDAAMEQAYANERSRFRSVLLVRSRVLAAQLRDEIVGKPSDSDSETA